MLRGISCMLVAAATMLFGAAAAEENIENKYDGYYLDWHDEFEGDRLNEELWQVETGYKRNNELQYYSCLLYTSRCV